MTHKSPITTHVLNTNLGKPASGVPVLLEMQTPNKAWKKISSSKTDSDGRAHSLHTGSLKKGAYRLTFDTKEYFKGLREKSFYPVVCITFEVTEMGRHYHVPLLLSRYGYSTYRGS